MSASGKLAATLVAGLQGYLVLSGSTQIENVGDYVYQPTRILGSVQDLVAEIRSGQPSNRLDSPGFSGPVKHPLPRNGTRHQTDIFALHKPRPRPAMTK